MTVTLNIPPDVEAGLLAQAQGLSLEAYLEVILRERTDWQQGLTRSQLAGQRIRELHKSKRLGGILIKELTEEGRE